MELSEEVFRPRLIDTTEYVKARLDQIAELLEVVSSNAGGDESTSAPRTLFQRLPRHMRRRAMSHNVKRLPRLFRPISVNLNKKKKKKMPSRIWRRRASRLIRRSMVENSKPRWLSTHIWHAKRFHMEAIWGFKLAVKCCQKTFRPNYRSSLSSSIITDRSYLTCLQFTLIKNTSISFISNLLSKFCRKKCSPTFLNLFALSGNFETFLLLFKPGDDFNEFIGPCRFSWFLPNKLNLWIHPSIELDFLKEISLLNEIKIISPSKYCNNTAEKLEASVELNVLKNKISRFQLIGPKSLIYLNCVFKLVLDKELDNLDCSGYRDIHNWWRLFSTKIVTNSSLQSGTLINLLVEDPRLFRAQRSLNNKFIEENNESNYSNIPLPPSNNSKNLKINLWNWKEFEDEMLPRRLTNSDFEKICVGKLVLPSRTDFKVPIILILHLPQKCKNSLGGFRVDFLCPTQVSYDFWLAFQFAKCRAIGLKNWEHLNFENGLVNFPNEFVDSFAGKRKLKEEIELIEKNSKKSHKCKLAFIKLQKCLKLINLMDNNLFVLKERLLLKQIDYWLKNRERRRINDDEWINEEEILNNCKHCFVPICLKMLSKGIPKKFSLIYTTDNYILKKESENIKKFKEIENEEEKIEGEFLLEQNGYKNKKEIVGGFLPLLEENLSNGIFSNELENKPFDKQINLKNLFPQNLNKKELKTLRNKRKKERKKRKKKIEEEKNGLKECLIIEEEKEKIDDTRQPPIGFIIVGNYSFIEARGTALGYALLSSLKAINTDRIVFVQNTEENFYKAMIEINLSIAEI
uniref:Ribonucleases P/MRP protein subunit POP1 n=1 Tax=Meloidogyne incognita TaxID=6306 RepID=A0A914MW41_MELIC